MGSAHGPLSVNWGGVRSRLGAALDPICGPYMKAVHHVLSGDACLEANHWFV